jgi:hypothetical protein
MTLVAVVVAVLALVVFGWFSRRRFWTWKQPRPEPGRPARDGDDFEDYNEKFLRNFGGKTGSVDLVRTYNADDVMLLRSLLDAEGVETYVQFSSLGALYPTVATIGFNDSVITIYRSDLDVARRVVEDFLAGWDVPQAGTGGVLRSRPELLVPRG